MRTLGKIIKYILICILAISILGIAALLLFEQPVPEYMLKRITSSLSNTNYLVRADSASFLFSRGLKINNLRVYDRSKKAAKPMASAACIDLALNLRRIPWSRQTLLKSVMITDFKYPRLPDGYYIPDSIEFPGQPDFKEIDEPLVLNLPALQPFRLKLVRPEVLGVAAKSVAAESVSVTPDGIRIDGIHLDWPDADVPMALDGSFELNLETQRVEGEVRGHARQHNIRPMLVALDITNSYAFIDSFTRVEKPVDASCAFDVNLRNNDLHLHLDLAPEGGCYNRVPLESARGPLDVRVFVRDVYQNAKITVGPLVAKLADGTQMTGLVVYENTNDVGYVDFDVSSNTSLSNALAVADVMNDGTLDCLQCETPPHLTLRGRLAVDPKYAATNDIFGTVAFKKGSFFGIPLRNASVSYKVDGTTIDFKGGHAKTPRGGSVFGAGRISVPEFKQELSSFSVDLRTDGVPLLDATDLFKVDADGRNGKINAKVSLSGPLTDDLSTKLCGKGTVTCSDGRLAQMKLFAGFTEFLAAKVPGIASLVNQSNGTLEFTITNGVMNVSRLIVEGDVFSIRGSGTYSIPDDNLDFAAHVQLFRNDSIVSKLTSPIIWPFSKLLMEFKVFGSIDEPKWDYVSALDRLKK